MGMDVTGTMLIIRTQRIIQIGINTIIATTSTPQNSMQESCAQSVVVDTHSRWNAEVIQMRQIPMETLVVI